MRGIVGGAAVVVLGVVLTAGPAGAASTDREPPPARPAAAPSAEREYGRGLVARQAKDWQTAVLAFRKALDIRPAYPEAWNELGYALRNQGRYAESLAAYDEALRLKPNFPEAL